MLWAGCMAVLQCCASDTPHQMRPLTNLLHTHAHPCSLHSPVPWHAAVLREAADLLLAGGAGAQQPLLVIAKGTSGSGKTTLLYNTDPSLDFMAGELKVSGLPTCSAGDAAMHQLQGHGVTMHRATMHQAVCAEGAPSAVGRLLLCPACTAQASHALQSCGIAWQPDQDCLCGAWCVMACVPVWHSV